ncbi:MAG: hypothetical protein Q7T60_16730, partial [Sphingopyxis sp.]|nr:hypothetical protein [Sphingopyxis sp.]
MGMFVVITLVSGMLGCDVTGNSEGAVAKAATTAPKTAAASARRSFPFTVELEAKPSAEQARIAKTTLAPLFAEMSESLGHSYIDYAVAMVDLNDDGRDDMVVHVKDGMYCGQWGCPGRAILATSTGFSREAIQLGVCFNATMTVLPTLTKGM